MGPAGLWGELGLSLEGMAEKGLSFPKGLGVSWLWVTP